MPQYLANTFYQDVVTLLLAAKRQTVQQINQTLVSTYFQIGKKIVEEEQKGEERAAYGKQIIKNLSAVLQKEFGRGFSVRNLEQMRAFFLVYSKAQTVSAEFQLSWSHYLKLIRIDNEPQRRFYEIESIGNNWSVRELNRQFDSGLYERLLLNRDKQAIKELSEKGQIITRATDAVKDPYVLEFLELKEETSYSESELEHAIIDKLEHFLLELGKGFTFVARQKRISFSEDHFYINLVFYNRLLRCFVLIDLKIGKLKHQDIGQMQMYVNFYDRKVKLDEENKTIGIILCQDKNEMLVEITLPETNDQIFASKYKTVLPTKKELKDILGQKLR